MYGLFRRWWGTFLNTTRGDKPNEMAVALMNRILHDTVVYMQAGYAAGVLPPRATGDRTPSSEHDDTVPRPRERPAEEAAAPVLYLD